MQSTRVDWRSILVRAVRRGGMKRCLRLTPARRGWFRWCDDGAALPRRLRAAILRTCGSPPSRHPPRSVPRHAFAPDAVAKQGFAFFPWRTRRNCVSRSGQPILILRTCGSHTAIAHFSFQLSAFFPGLTDPSLALRSPRRCSPVRLAPFPSCPQFTPRKSRDCSPAHDGRLARFPTTAFH